MNCGQMSRPVLFAAIQFLSISNRVKSSIVDCCTWTKACNRLKWLWRLCFGRAELKKDLSPSTAHEPQIHTNIIASWNLLSQNPLGCREVSKMIAAWTFVCGIRWWCTNMLPTKRNKIMQNLTRPTFPWTPLWLKCIWFRWLWKWAKSSIAMRKYSISLAGDESRPNDENHTIQKIEWQETNICPFDVLGQSKWLFATNQCLLQPSICFLLFRVFFSFLNRYLTYFRIEKSSNLIDNFNWANNWLLIHLPIVAVQFDWKPDKMRVFFFFKVCRTC